MPAEHTTTIAARSGSLVTRPIVRLWLWLVVATSSAVYFEPAICDLLSIGLCAFAFATGLRVPRRLGMPVLLLGLFLLGNLVASGFAPEPSASLTPMAIRAYLIFCWWLLIASLVCEEPARAYVILWNAYCFAAVLAALVGILAFVGIISDDGQLLEFGRVRSLFKDANVYGPFLVPPIIFALNRLETSAGALASLHFAVFSVLTFGLLLGFSRGSWLNFAFALGCYFLLRLRSQRSARKRRRLLLTAVGVLIAAAVSLLIASSNERLGSMLDLRARVIQAYDVGTENMQGVGRFGAQLEFLQLAMTSPLGIGAGQSESDEYQGVAPHNLYLHVIVEAGWVGGLAFVAFILYTLSYSARIMSKPSDIQGAYQVAFASLLGILLQSFFVDSTHWRHFYLLLAMLWGPGLVSFFHRPATPRTQTQTETR